VFNDGEYQSINLNGWLASNPSGVVANNLGISEQLVDQLPRRNQDFDR
jgi:oxalate decarboxylase